MEHQQGGGELVPRRVPRLLLPPCFRLISGDDLHLPDAAAAVLGWE